MSPRPSSWTRQDARLVSVFVPLMLLMLVVLGWEETKFSNRRVGFQIEQTDQGLQILALRQSAPGERAGLETGDIIRSVKGLTIETLADYHEAVLDHPRGELALFVVERQGQLTDVGVIPGMPFPLFSYSSTVLTVLAYLLIGPLALRKRPGYLRSRLLCWLCFAIAFEVGLPGVHTSFDLWAATVVLLSGFQIGMELHLASVIPERQAWLDRLPWMIKAYYFVGISTSLVVSSGLVLLHFSLDSFVPWNAENLYSRYMSIAPLYALGVLFLIGRQAWTYPEKQGRQQATMVLLGVLPWALVLLARQLGLLDSWLSFAWEDLVWNLALLCYPLAVLTLLYQEVTSQERVLLDLTRRVHNAPSIAEISRIVSDGLQVAFHPKSTQVFYRERHSRDLTLGHSSGPHLAEEVIPQDSSLLRLVEAWGEAADYPQDLVGLSPTDAEWLDQLRAKLVVPLAGRDKRLLGLLVLGAKKSEEMYTVHDRNLLRALTTQIALVYENARLEEKVSESQQVQLEVLSGLAGGELGLVKECPKCGRCFDADTEVCADDGFELQPALAVERVIEGRYRLDQRLGKGGMGAIYSATDLHLSRPVVIKVLLGNFATREAARRFETEAHLTARLHHPNVITLHDYGTTSTGAAYLVLELLEGETLAERIERQGAQVPCDVAPRFDEICAAVLEAHRHQIVHRDLKPANIFIARGNDGGETIKILDFGVAKVQNAPENTVNATTPGALIGTFRYMAPEQLRGEEADERSDIFAIGVMVVLTLTAELPFAGTAPPRLLKSITEGYSLPQAAPSTRPLEAVLRRCLHPVRSNRYSTVQELRNELIPVLMALEHKIGTEPT